jgi:2'-5' RNA ligase
MLRLFVALELPQTWLDALAETQDRMKAAIAADASLAGVRVRWVRPQGIHLTLKFIGEVKPQDLEAIKAKIGQAVPQRPDTHLTLAGTGSFGGSQAPRVVWAGVHDSPPQSLAGLAEAIDVSLAGAGVPSERRRFNPHLTLARFPGDASNAQRDRATALATAVELPKLPPWKVLHVSLMRSFLESGGARYQYLDHWPGDPLQPDRPVI